MKGLRVQFTVTGEEPKRGLIVEHVTLPFRQTKDENSGSIPISYYQIKDDDGIIHTVSPASVQCVVDETSKNDVYEAMYAFLDFVRPRLPKMTAEIEAFNKRDKNKYHLRVDFGRKGIAVLRKDEDARQIEDVKTKDKNEVQTGTEAQV